MRTGLINNYISRSNRYIAIKRPMRLLDEITFFFALQLPDKSYTLNS